LEAAIGRGAGGQPVLRIEDGQIALSGGIIIGMIDEKEI
jgi:hypothetical protein